jgi:hypothetical protein
MAYLTQSAVTDITGSLSAALKPNIADSLQTALSGVNRNADHTILMSRALTAGNAALLNHSTASPLASVTGKYGLAYTVMNDHIPLSSKYSITDPTNILSSGKALLHTGNLWALSGRTPAWMNGSMAVTTQSALVYPYTHGIKDMTDMLTTGGAWMVDTKKETLSSRFGVAAVSVNNLHTVISTALKTTDWQSGITMAAALKPMLTSDYGINSYALKAGYPVGLISTALTAAGKYGAAGISMDLHKIVTGPALRWKSVVDPWLTKGLGAFHDYQYQSHSEEIILPSYTEPTITEEVEIRYTLQSRLQVLNTSLAVSYKGAAEALNHRRADHIRQACISMRQLLDFFVEELFTIDEFRQWSGYSENLLRRNWKGEVIGVQRKAAYQFVTRMLVSAPAPKKFLELMEKCNGGCHRFDGNYSLTETISLFHKCEAMLEVLLNATDAASN